MKVLVTGGAGYVGSHFVREVLEKGLSPVVYDDLSAGHAWAAGEAPLIEAGMEDRGSLDTALSAGKVEAVFHFAGSINVGESVSDPGKYFRNNYFNTVSLLDAMASAGVRYFVFSSTAAVYGVHGDSPLTEDMTTRPVNPYGLSKLFVEETLPWYERAHGIKYVSLRYFNAAGAAPSSETGELHSPETHLIPLVLQAALGLRPHIEIYGTDYPTPDGTCLRDYVHVCDLAAAHLLALDYLRGGGESGAFNLGGERGVSVREVIESAGRVTGRGIPVKEGPRREGDPSVLVSSSGLAMRTLGWKPQYRDIDTIIGHAWKWALNARDKGYM